MQRVIETCFVETRHVSCCKIQKGTRKTWNRFQEKCGKKIDHADFTLTLLCVEVGHAGRNNFLDTVNAAR